MQYRAGMPNCTMVVFDLETVQPKHTTGKWSSKNPYGSHSARIWNMAFMCNDELYEMRLDHGLNPDDIAQSSTEFMVKNGTQHLFMEKSETKLEEAWPGLCQWLISLCPGGTIVLVAQQALRGDELVLSVEMARHGVEWPSGMVIRGLDPLVTIRRSFVEQGLTYPPRWTVASVYETFTGLPSHGAHGAAKDVTMLVTNMKMAWALLFLSSMGVRRTEANFHSIYATLDAFSVAFWADFIRMSGQKPEKLMDSRCSLWSLLNTETKGVYDRQIIEELETSFHVYTLDDLEAMVPDLRFRFMLVFNPITGRSSLPTTLGEGRFVC